MPSNGPCSVKIAIIPARGASQRIPRKNIRLFHGRPIIAYSIDTAHRSGLFDRVIVSTEDEEIANVARDYDAGVLLRDPALAHNDVGTQEVARDALKILGRDLVIDWACVIYATSPMLIKDDLWRGWVAANEPGVTYAFSVAERPFADAGAFYWGSGFAFLAGVPLVSESSRIIPLPAERCIDINTPEDWSRAEAMYAAWKGKE